MTHKANVLKILVVEDEPIAAMVAQEMITQLGHNADIATHGKEALQKFSNGYDLVFMDIGLPDMTGMRVASEIRQREKGQKNIPIIALTAYTDNQLKTACFDVGIEEVIYKPTTREKLNEIISKYCVVTVN